MILLIPDLNEYGGILTYFLNLLEIHKKNHIETVILLQKKYTHLEILHKIKSYGFKVIVMRSQRGLWNKAFFSILYDILFVNKIIKKLSPDVVHVSVGGRPALGYLFLRHPILYTIHSTPTKTAQGGIRLWLKLFSKYAYGIAVSNFCKGEIVEKMEWPGEQLEVVHNAVKTQVLPKRHISQKVVLTVGHVVNYKNPAMWIDVANRVLEKHPEWKFVWVGSGSLLPEMLLRVNALGLKGRAIFKGSSQSPQKYYRHAAVYFQPSTLESHGLAVLEAMSFGIPCVVSNVGGMPESVADKVTGFVAESNNPEEMAQRLIELIENSSLRRYMGNNSIKRARSDLFSKRTQEKKILHIYNELLGVHKK